MYGKGHKLSNLVGVLSTDSKETWDGSLQRVEDFILHLGLHRVCQHLFTGIPLICSIARRFLTTTAGESVSP